MKFLEPHCPQCGEIAKGTLELIPGLALLTEESPGVFSYEGYTEVYWDGQESIRNQEGEVELECPSGHTWFTPRLEDS